jgi:hypothetical protein
MPPVANTSSSAQRILRRLDHAWTTFTESYAGLSEAELTEPRTIGEWSVKDVIGHVTTWEEEALQYLPRIAEGGRPPRYTRYGGIDAFNALTVGRKRALSVVDVLRARDDTHHRLVELVQHASPALLEGPTRFRHRLRFDTYAHYPHHTGPIREWRVQRGL